MLEFTSLSITYLLLLSGAIMSSLSAVLLWALVFFSMTSLHYFYFHQKIEKEIKFIVITKIFFVKIDITRAMTIL